MFLDWLSRKNTTEPKPKAERHPSYRICQKAGGMYYVEKFNPQSRTWYSACFETYALQDCERFVERKLNNDQDKVIRVYN